MISISNIPNNLKVYHVKDHQDERKNKQQLFIPELLNTTANKLINSNVKILIATNILLTPVAVYVNKRYIPNNCISVIWLYYGERTNKNSLW